MALTKEDLREISNLLDVKLQPIDHRLGNVENRLENVENRLENVENRLGKVENRLGNVENRLERLRSEVSAVKGDLIKLERRISDAYQLALDAWGIGTENRSWLEHGKLHA